MKVLMKGYSDLVHSYEHFLKNQEEEHLRQDEALHRKHLEECCSDIENAERRGETKGKAEGLVLALLIILKTRFQSVPESIQERLFSLNEPEKLERLTIRSALCSSLDEFAESLESR